MPGYSVTLVAQDDIEDTVRHIGSDNPKAAERFEDDLYNAFGHLAANPHLGHRRSDLTDRPVFFLTVKRFSYVIIYKIKCRPSKSCALSTGIAISRRCYWTSVTFEERLTGISSR